MAAASLLATGSTDATTSDIVLAAGDAITIGLKGDTSPVQADISIKDDGGNWIVIGQLKSAPRERAVAITSPGTYRVSRSGGQTFGVYSA